jgi:uncharacterized glyoxalase superfamily protein PhnB
MAPGSLTAAGTGSLTIEDDVSGHAERLAAAGVTFVKPPTTQPWGRRSVWIRDPDGNVANLFQAAPAQPG